MASNFLPPCFMQPKRRRGNQADIISSGSDESLSDSESDSSSSSDTTFTTIESEKSYPIFPTEWEQCQSTVPAQGHAAIVWKQEDCFPQRFEFSGQHGVTIADLDNSSSPLQVFLQFIPQELFEHIASQTNKYAYNQTVNLDSHNRVWSNTTSDEIKGLVALVILMGVIPKPDIQAYWSREPLTETPFFASTMPRDRFMQLLLNLHFNNNDDDEGIDRLFKLRPVIDTLTENFKTVYVPSQNITTDQSVLKFHGQLKQHNSANRARFGIKVYKTCQSSGDAAGYTWNIKICTSKDRGQIPASTQAVLDLNEDLLDCGYNIFLDNSFSSPDLFLRLRERQTNACGTVKLNRKQMPSNLKSVKLKRGEYAFRSSDSGLLALVWKGRKDVKILSTMHSSSAEDSGRIDKDGNPIEKPSCILDYNKNNHCKYGVDLSDQLASSHRSMRKSVKWYKKLFFYLVDLCLVNSFIVYKLQDHKIQYAEFRIALIRDILQTVILPLYNTRSRPHNLPSPNRLTGRHFPFTLPPTPRNSNPCKRCVVCKSDGLRRETRYACDACNIPLCVHPCFKIYHTKRDY